MGGDPRFGGDSSGGEYSGPGDLVFGLVVFFVLFLGLVVSPTLSATAINGDVRDGTMAPLQATALSAADIVLGKLLASWAASLAFLAVALPFIVIAYFDGRMPALAMLTVMLVLAVELLVVCAHRPGLVGADRPHVGVGGPDLHDRGGARGRVADHLWPAVRRRSRRTSP